MNPALPGGALDLDAAGAADRWAASARASYTVVPYGRLQQGRGAAPNPMGLGIDVHLGAMQLGARAPTGTTLDARLPFGVLITRTLESERSDDGLGDLELRVRQELPRRLGLGLGLGGGLVLPTGPYVARSGAANLPPEAATLTLGRGVAWWIAEADLGATPHRRVGTLAQLSARGPLAHTADDFAWGVEVRGTVAARLRVMPWLAFALATDLQWRAGASEPDPFGGARLDSANVGGWQWSLSPSAAFELPGAWVVSVGARVPLLADVTGNQLVPGVGAFVALAVDVPWGTSRSGRGPAHPAVVGSAGTAERPAPVAGAITVIDYWATWCAPCAEIGRRLDAAAPRWPEVRILEVDASAWPADGAPALPDGATGLPVIEIYDRQGRRRHVLHGEAALGVVEVVEALRREELRREAAGADESSKERTRE